MLPRTCYLHLAQERSSFSIIEGWNSRSKIESFATSNKQFGLEIQIPDVISLQSDQLTSCSILKFSHLEDLHKYISDSWDILYKYF